MRLATATTDTAVPVDRQVRTACTGPARLPRRGGIVAFAAAVPSGPLSPALARRLDALICALLRVQLAERSATHRPGSHRAAMPRPLVLSGAGRPHVALSADADAEPYPVELRVIRPSLSATARSLPTQQEVPPPPGPDPDEPQIVDNADNTRDVV